MMRTLSVALFTAYACTSTLLAQCPSTGDCREVHASAGCEMPECCTLVCDVDLLCCAITWDQICVDFALELCGGISCPSQGECSVIHENSGCADFVCCELITTLDGWCTYAGWDEICAREAQELCGEAPCELAASSAVDEAEPCYERFNDGCSVGFESGRIAFTSGIAMKGRITGGGPRDLDWFALDHAARTRYRFTIEAEFPVETQYFLGDCEGPNETPWLVAEPLCSGTRTLNFIANAGVSSLILGAGNIERPYRDGLECDDIDPENPPDPKAPPPLQLYGVHWVVRFDAMQLADIDGDGSVSAGDLALLLANWGPIDLSVAIDPRAADADLDGDHLIGASDLSLLLAQWS